MSSPTHPRYLLLKIDPRSRRRAERLTDFLVKSGFQVTDASSIHDADRIVRRIVPTLVLVFDDVRRGVDALTWLNRQQAGVSAQLAMTPLLILADPSRRRNLRVQELPDRVRILPHDIPPETLSEFIDDMLSAWLF